MAEDFAERLKNIRATRGLTQNELGDRAGLPTSSIAQFETNARKPSFDTLRKLSKALEVSTDYLLGSVDEPKAPEAGNVLFRNYEKLSAHDQELLQNIAAMMAAKNQKDDKTN
jgi:transcriptional regulator with XRE-family HTH domain